ncbi:DoxX family membrane protein [Actinacidiphila yeochonensis]|uniref:DoxX family membrane protein n=1 Tax=Actinacidiphila yeochonensis TaxID=89050 RepID=UPI00099CEBB3|nr:DoxX family membrane protein [Actinacidiphila yeochonensis]
MLEQCQETARRYALLPLRIFLGVTFVYAGLDKLTSGTFFTDSANGSLVQTMHAVRDSAAIPGLVDLALKAPHAFGYAMAFGELAVGLGILLGLLGRVAALGGALISLSLWLTMSWATTPYYYGNDLVYLMAWLPLLLAGTPYLSLDGLWRRGRAAGSAARAEAPVPAQPATGAADAPDAPARSAPSA